MVGMAFLLSGHPRTKSAVLALKEPKASSVCQKISGDGTDSQQKAAELVQIPLSVTDQAGDIVPNLRAQDFTITVDGRAQTICSLSSADSLWTIGFILDNSGGAAKHLSWELAAVAAFLRFANPGTEYFASAAARPPNLIADFTPLTQQFVAEFRSMQPGKPTALLDAIFLGIDKMRKAKNGHKALIVLSDARDTSSRHSEADVRDALRHSSLQVHFVGSPNWDLQTVEARNGYHDLQDFAADTGGVMMPVSNGQESAHAGAAISALLRHQYLLSYGSDDTPVDGRWHKLKVGLSSLAALPHATIYAPGGYYAPAR